MHDCGRAVSRSGCCLCRLVQGWLVQGWCKVGARLVLFLCLVFRKKWFLRKVCRQFCITVCDQAESSRRPDTVRKRKLMSKVDGLAAGSPSRFLIFTKRVSPHPCDHVRKFVISISDPHSRAPIVFGRVTTRTFRVPETAESHGAHAGARGPWRWRPPCGASRMPDAVICRCHNGRVSRCAPAARAMAV
jgi:hypothetical protein